MSGGGEERFLFKKKLFEEVRTSSTICCGTIQFPAFAWKNWKVISSNSLLLSCKQNLATWAECNILCKSGLELDCSSLSLFNKLHFNDYFLKNQTSTAHCWNGKWEWCWWTGIMLLKAEGTGQNSQECVTNILVSKLHQFELVPKTHPGVECLGIWRSGFQGLLTHPFPTCHCVLYLPHPWKAISNYKGVSALQSKHYAHLICINIL